MNLKFDVVRFANEDVIATSCDKHPNTKHYFAVENHTSGSIYIDCDLYEAGSTISTTGSDRDYDKFDPVLTPDTAVAALGKWYYLNEAGKCVECDGNHDDYTRVIH